MIKKSQEYISFLLGFPKLLPEPAILEINKNYQINNSSCEFYKAREQIMTKQQLRTKHK
ncbi:MAG: hypothetical protein ACLRFI_03760 [Alphaproteobacteria bacterium]